VRAASLARPGGRAAVQVLAACAVLSACQHKEPAKEPPATDRPAHRHDHREIETVTRGLATLASGFHEAPVIQGLTRPTAIRFSPDGRVFVAEKRGRIWVYDGLDDTTPTQFAQLDTNVHDYWDRGLLGVALHPQFPAQPFVYVLYSLDAPVGGMPPVWNDDCPTPPGANDSGCVIGARLSRLQADGNVAGAETVLLEGWGQQYPSHSIGDLAFGADGALYVSAGDGASFTFIDYGQRGTPKNPLGDPPVPVGGDQTPPSALGGALRAQSLRRPNGPAVLNGAILRLDPMTGAALPDNPLFGSPDVNARRIVAQGLRNPFRFTTRPGTSELWLGDVGFGTWEEIDRIVNPLDPVVKNFGWPCYEGNARQSGYDGANLELCERLYGEANAVVPPFFTYAHSAKVVPGEACPVGSSSIAALAFYTGDKFPARYRGALFFADYARQCAWVMLPGADGTPDPTQVETFGVEVAHPVDLRMGPDGNLYYVDVVGGEVRRISYLLPRAVATAAPLAGPPPLVVDFDGSGSVKPLPTDTLTFAWDLDGDGQFDDSDDEKPSILYRTAGTVTVRLRVTDQRGTISTSDPLTIMVSDMPMTSTPPVPVIDAPASNLPWKVGDAITFSGHATDAEDGPLPASALSWLLVMQHCPSGCHAHVLQSWSGLASATFSAPDHEFPSHIELVLVAVDSSGIRRTTSVRLDPETVRLTLQSQPPGLPLSVGLDTFVAPVGRELIAGGRTSLSAAPIELLGGNAYAFVGWSSGQPATHDLGPLLTDQTLLATYRPAGLTGQYFDQLEFVDPRLLRVDADLNFDWGRASPHPTLDAETFSVRWTGWVLPPTTDLYVFSTDSDDGVRLWVNGIPVINNWTVHPVQRNTGIPIPLLANQKARIQLDFFDNEIDAIIKLYWASRTQPMAIVPTARLFPGCAGTTCPAGLTCIAAECMVPPCNPACAADQRCEGGQCVDACKDLTCQGGKCVGGSCVPRCQGVTCQPGFACQPSTGLCENQCQNVTCGPNLACAQGACRPACAVNGCPSTDRCNATSGVCEPRCQGVTCDPGLACAPETGMCQDRCLTLACPGQACQGGECKPTCVVQGCAVTETCNATTGACLPKCAMITCAPGAECVPTTGQCEDRCLLGNITCPANFQCVLGACQPACSRQGCSTAEACNTLSGLCVPKCQGVVCQAGFACVPTSGACAEICPSRTCPAGQTCSVGECRPACAVQGCPSTASCNASTGACDEKCAAGVACNAGFACNPASGACEDLCLTAPPTCPTGFQCAQGRCQAVCLSTGCPGTDRCDPDTGHCGRLPDGGPPTSADAGRDAYGSGSGGGPPGPDARATPPGTQQLADRSGGCSCDVGARPPGRGGGVWAALALAVAVVTRARKRRRR
jgi:glucose/arabinose dehydrogenase